MIRIVDRVDIFCFFLIVIFYEDELIMELFDIFFNLSLEYRRI